MNPQGWLCSACCTFQASTFCSCGSHGETFLCDNCVGSHYLKNPGRVHTIVPISAYGQNTIPGYYERLQVRSTNVPLGKRELLKSLEEVDICMAEFSTKIQEIVNAVWAYGQNTWSKLQQVRADLERDINLAIEEVERTMDQDNPQLQYELSQYLRNFGKSSTSMKMFRYQVDKTPYPASLENTLHYSHGLFAGEQRFIPGIAGDLLTLYDLHNGQTRVVQLGYSLESVEMCVIDDETVMCMMSMNAYRSSRGQITAGVYTFGLRDYQFSQFPSMNVPRTAVGILKQGNFVYVFGGLDCQNGNESCCCEKFNLMAMTWDLLPNMLSPKISFTPCLFESEIYLPWFSPPLNTGQVHGWGKMRKKYNHEAMQAGSNYQSQLEAFNVHTEQFKAYPIPLPPGSGPSVSFVVDGELMILAQTQISKCRVKTEKTFNISNVVKGGSGLVLPQQVSLPMSGSGQANPYSVGLFGQNSMQIPAGVISGNDTKSTVPPVVVGRKVYWGSDGRLVHFDLDTNTIVST